MKERVVIAMSGGVDSSTAAYILLKQGYEVIGISMKLPNMTEISEGSCCGVQGIDDARQVAQKLSIPFYVLDYEKEFKDKVIDYFCKEYKNGKTPNPCIICNEKIKFGSLLDKSKNLGAKYLATGHYAKIEYINKRWVLKKGKDKEKDQSYFLFSLSQKQLSHIIFPLGNYTKVAIMKLAKKIGLKVYNKKSSQEICFIPQNYRKFLKENIGEQKPGLIINKNGKTIGKHQGIAFYTIGQRKGIGAHKKPYYVVAINKKENNIMIDENNELYKDELIAENVNWISELTNPVKVKIRYKHPETYAKILPLSNDKVKIKFDSSQRAITPGQAVVFYDDDIVIGGGWIEK